MIKTLKILGVILMTVVLSACTTEEVVSSSIGFGDDGAFEGEMSGDAGASTGKAYLRKGDEVVITIRGEGELQVGVMPRSYEEDDEQDEEEMTLKAVQLADEFQEVRVVVPESDMYALIFKNKTDGPVVFDGFAGEEWRNSRSALTLEDRGLELIGEVDTLAENKGYMTLLSGSHELEALIEAIGEADYREPEKVFQIEDLDQIILNKMLGEHQLSGEILPLIKGKFASVLPSQINAMGGAKYMAVASILSHQASFIDEELVTTTTYLYDFGHEYWFMVTFVPDEEGIVNTNVSLLVNEALTNCETLEQVKLFLEEILESKTVTVTTVSEKE